MGVRPPDGPIEDSSDLAQMWNEAIIDFKEKTHIDLTLAKFSNIGQAMRQAEAQQNAWNAYRHDDGKVDQVRSAFSRNLGNISSIVSVVKFAADTAAVVPPGIPAAQLVTAFTVVFQSFQNVSADYDRVNEFFCVMGSFLDRISMLENESPKLGPFQRCVRQVFSSMLVLCGIAADYKEKKRFKKWLHALKDGSEDPKLAAAYDRMEAALKDLMSAVGLATLKFTIEIDKRVTTVVSSLDKVLAFEQEIKTHVVVLREGQEAQDRKLDVANVKLNAILEKMENLSSTTATQGSRRPKDKQKEPDAKGKGGASSKKHEALAKINTHFKDTATVRKKVKAQRQDINESSIKGTATWILNNEQYRSWLDENQPLLWLSGPAGIGKTFLAHAIIADLEERYQEKPLTSVAYFYFRQEDEDLRTFKHALRCAVVQIAEQDTAYCEQVASEISRNVAEEQWKQFFADRYSKSSESHLYFVLDGIDEVSKEDQTIMLELFHQVTGQDLNIHLLFTSRPELMASFSGAIPATMKVTKSDMIGDMSELIDARCRSKSRFSLQRLQEFRRSTKRRIKEKLREHADGMLYVEHMLRRWNAIGREGSVLKEIEKGIPDGIDSLYKLLLAECRRGRTDEQYKALKTLFATLAFSQRALTLDEAAELIKLTDPAHTFSIDDEIIGRSARILNLRHSRRDDDEDDDDDDDNDADDQDMNPTGTTNDDPASYGDVIGQMPLAFQERSLKEYFQAINVEENGLRTSPSLAHFTIFELCVDLLCGDKVSAAPVSDGLRLQGYASSFWADHFVNMRLDDLDAQHVAHVLTGLAKILRNQNNVSKTFEEHKVLTYTRLNERTGFLGKVADYVARAISDGLDGFDNETRAWVESARDSAPHLVLPLARGHILNWRKALRSAKALASYYFAKDALCLYLSVTADEDENHKEAVVRVASFFADIEMDADLLRTIGSALLGLEEHEAAIEYSLRSIEKSGEASENAFYAHWIMGEAYLGLAQLWEQPVESNESATENESAPKTAKTETIESNSDEDALQWQEALKHFDLALLTLPQGWKENPEGLKDAEGAAFVVMDRAYCEKLSGHSNDAIETYSLVKTILSGKTLNGWDLDDIARAPAWSEDPKGYINLLRAWTTQERVAWFRCIFDDEDYDTIANLHSYTKLSGEENFDFVVQCFENYIKTIKRGSSRLIAPLSALVDFYSIVACNQDKALETCTKALELKQDEVDDNVAMDLRSVRAKKAKILFAKFRASSDPDVKTELLTEMGKLPSFKIGKETEDDFAESHTALMLAIMTRTVGQTMEFQRMMEKSFQRCKNGLLDSVGFNDSVSLRLLAKVLACVPGLEEDAQLAISCQFSVTDPAVSHGDTDNSVPSDANAAVDEEATLNGSVPTENPARNTSQEPGIDAAFEAIASGDEKDGNIVAVVEEISHKTDTGTNFQSRTIVVEPITLSAEHQQSTIPNSTVKLDESRINAETLTQTTINEPSTSAKASSEPSEDLLPGSAWSVACDGDCGTTFAYWSQPIYLCIHCEDTDLCGSCLEKRRAMNRGEPCASWKPWCGQNHAYIKGPIEGWRGIKGGVIRIARQGKSRAINGEKEGTVDGEIASQDGKREEGEEVIEEVPFKQWLEDLEKVRWTKAWEGFWKGESFVRDVGM